MRPIAIVFASFLFASAAIASTNPVFTQYESARQALLKESVADVQKAAKQLTTAAHGAGQHALAAKSAELEKAANITKAREAFGAVSEEVIKYRASVSGEKPVVAYCSMAKKSWLQPKGAISNPYFDASMRGCGEVKAD